MYANVVTVIFAADHDPDGARTVLRNQVVPRVARHPGFAGGYWLAPTDGTGMSVTLWETEDQARDAARLVGPGSSPIPGVTVERIETREVYVKASPVLRERVRQLSRQRHELLARARQLQHQQRELLGRARQRRPKRPDADPGTESAPAPVDPSVTGVEH